MKGPIAMFKKFQHPITVVVADGHYDMYGPDDARSAWLSQMLKAEGGVSDTVADGIYHYNVTFNWRLQAVASLLLIED